ncbi:hypothetical protein HAX54_027548, partial [Datura stramonium]|nr:hypothetical protein [Datura stramonium]
MTGKRGFEGESPTKRSWRREVWRCGAGRSVMDDNNERKGREGEGAAKYFRGRRLVVLMAVLRVLHLVGDG